MKRTIASLILVSALVAFLVPTLVLTGTSAAQESERSFAPNVDEATGAIHVPEDYTEWATLGTWTHANTGASLGKLGPGAHQYHVVYTQPETIRHYLKTRQFPDGAVLVKELLHATSAVMTTGPSVGHATTTKGWFVMVRDTEGRHPDSPLWGDGWGWAFFNSDDSEHTVSTSYKSDCLGCHLPARPMAPSSAVEDDKWIYVHGYPVLRSE
jgi:hypothetical protein